MFRGNIWQAVVNALQQERVGHVFGLPGGDLLHDALFDVPQVKPVLVREESSGAFMAMAYARLTGKPGVCHASSGPGVANLVPGIMEAESACVPLVALAGASSAASAGMGAFQEADQIAIMKPITKWAERITQVERTPWVMRRAFAIAANGKPGPVFVEVPKDLGAVQGTSPDYTAAVYPLKFGGDPAAVENAARLITDARKPVLLAGGGAVASRASEQITELAKLIDMPVMTTPCGRGVLAEDHDLAFGLVGLYFNRLGEQLFGEADLIVGVGSRNEDFQSGERQFIPDNAKYIQIDIDPQEIGRNWLADVPIVGDAALVLSDLIQCLRDNMGAADTQNPWTRELCAARRSYQEEVADECRTNEVPIKTKRVVRELNQVFGKNTVLVNENGSQDLWSYCFPYYKVLDTYGCLAPGEQTCMGLGVAGAIGAKLARPDMKVVCVAGDAAFQMFMKELPTAVQHDAPVTYIVLNNYSLGWIKYGQKNRGDRFIASDFTVQPDFVGIAEASGCNGERVEQPAAIKPALTRALEANESGRTAVVEFVVDSWDFEPGFKRYYQRVRET